MDAIVAETPRRVATQWLAGLDAALAQGDIDAALNLFGKECYWRDLVTFTWNIVTLEGRDAVRAMLNANLEATKPSSWQLEGEAKAVDGVVEAWFTFETQHARGNGLVRLRDGKAWTLLTAMKELKGHEEKRGPTRRKGVEHGIHANHRTWKEQRAADEAELGYSRQPYVLVIGGGQGGIGLAARLKQLDVPTLVVDRHARPGDAWRKRYKSLCLHDPVWYDHMPYLPFPDTWPVFAPKDKIGDWLEMYTRVMELDYWSSSEVVAASWDDAAREWTVKIKRAGGEVTVKPRHVVLATGMSGIPNIPDFPGKERFKGTQCHSSEHASGAAWAGKKAVVIGSNNSAHDICADLWEHGADVTMVQRSSTNVVRSETLMELGMGDLYSERALANGITTEKADMIFASIPYRVLGDLHISLYERVKERDHAFYEKLKASGFMLDFGADESGLFMKYLRRGSGYYIDVGACELVMDGRIKLRSGVGIREITGNGVLLDDGTELPADLIVYATGYGSMNGWAARIMSQEMADRVGKCWGLGSDTAKDPGPWEGELRNMWKPTQQEGLWFHGGNLHQSRCYSHYLALQLKARMEKVPTNVYGVPAVHHLQ